MRNRGRPNRPKTTPRGNAHGLRRLPRNGGGKGLKRDFHAFALGDGADVRPVFRRDSTRGQSPSANSDRSDRESSLYKFSVDSVGTPEVLEKLGVIHNHLTLSNVASSGNMICSAATCNVAHMDSHELDTPGKRLKWAREKAGFATAGDFAKRVAIHPTTYRAYENDQNSFVRKADDFADRLGVTSRWLMKGGDIEPQTVDEMPLDHKARQLGLMLVPELELGYSMGGGSIFSDYRRTGFVPFQREWLRGMIRGSLQDLFVARGEGDSMTPTLLDGDIVLIDTAQKNVSQQDRIWALSYGDLGMIKRIRRMPGGQYRIMSDNPAVSDFDAVDGEMHVVGRVVWIGRRM